MDGIINASNNLDTNKGLDLILHTPGGDIHATTQCVNYLHFKFQNNIRAIIPQIAMSAGTIMSLACKSIIMGGQSSLGPIDPQYNGISASVIIEEFEKAREDVIKDIKLANFWQPIISRYPLGFIKECNNQIKLSKDIATDWLKNNMFKDEQNKEKIVENIIDYLSDHQKTLSHSRRISISECQELGLKIEKMDDNQKLQDTILTIHYAAKFVLSKIPARKIIVNQNGDMVILNK